MTYSHPFPLQTRSPVDWVIPFSLWTFLLSVCGLVVGFPIVAIIVLGGGMVGVVLQGFLPSGLFVLATGSLLAITVVAPLVGAGILTVLEVEPDQIFGDTNLKTPRLSQSIFASCPLTCDSFDSLTERNSRF